MVSPPTPPPRSPARGPSARTSTSHRTPPDASMFPETDNFDDDLPPPYTPAANPGEETVGLGPRRPFQQQPLLSSSSLHPYSNQPPHSSWQSPYIQPSPTGRGPSPGLFAQPGLAPWQTRQQYPQRQQASGGILGALFDTVRDIADVVSGAHDERSRSANAGAYAAPYASTNSLYAPPPGPPGPAHQPLPPRAASTPPRSPPSTVPDDGSPTRTPVPGHPLLRDGKLLVYPRDHLCVKCGFVHSLITVLSSAHGQARTRVTKTMIPLIHVANVGRNMESHTQAHSHTHHGLPPGTIAECNVPCRNSCHPISPDLALSHPGYPPLHHSLLTAHTRGRPNTHNITDLYLSHIIFIHQTRDRRTMS